MAQNLEMLKERLQQLEEERQAILKLLEIWGENPPENRSAAVPKITASSYSIQGRVVDAVIELIHKLGKQVGNSEILDYLEERGISLGDTKNKQAAIAAMLSREISKNNPRLKRVTRGVYDLK